MTRFDKFISIIFKNEGIYSNDPSDSGGKTKYGISDARDGKVDGLVDTNDDGKGDLKVESLTLDNAKQIYKHAYYDFCQIDKITNELLALHLFDFAVNSGVGRACKLLQEIAGVKQDGQIGNITIAKVNSTDYSKQYIQERLNFYNRIGVGKNAKFLNGWKNRISNTTKSL